MCLLAASFSVGHGPRNGRHYYTVAYRLYPQPDAQQIKRYESELQMPMVIMAAVTSPDTNTGIAAISAYTFVTAASSTNPVTTR